MKTYTVYKHTCPNGMVYIGQTSMKSEKRWNYGHGYHGNKCFYEAIIEYGWRNIKHEILYTGLTKQEADEIEISLISRYKASNLSYNLCDGGYGTKGHRWSNSKSAWNKGCTHTTSEETKQKISEAMKGKNKGKSNVNKGRHRVYRADGTFYMSK